MYYIMLKYKITLDFLNTRCEKNNNNNMEDYENFNFNRVKYFKWISYTLNI
jgi:hypothetical protein